MTTPAHTRAVAEVLAEHQSRPTGSPFCRCGWRPSMFLNDTESDRLQHVAHQADMLAAAGLLADPAHDAQVAAKALREAASAIGHAANCYPDPTEDPYHGCACRLSLLYARADRLEAK